MNDANADTEGFSDDVNGHCTASGGCRPRAGAGTPRRTACRARRLHDGPERHALAFGNVRVALAHLYSGGNVSALARSASPLACARKSTRYCRTCRAATSSARRRAVTRQVRHEDSNKLYGSMSSSRRPQLPDAVRRHLAVGREQPFLEAAGADVHLRRAEVGEVPEVDARATAARRAATRTRPSAPSEFLRPQPGRDHVAAGEGVGATP